MGYKNCSFFFARASLLPTPLSWKSYKYHTTNDLKKPKALHRDVFLTCFEIQAETKIYKSGNYAWYCLKHFYLFLRLNIKSRLHKRIITKSMQYAIIFFFIPFAFMSSSISNLESFLSDELISFTFGGLEALGWTIGFFETSFDGLVSLEFLKASFCGLFSLDWALGVLGFMEASSGALVWIFDDHDFREASLGGLAAFWVHTFLEVSLDQGFLGWPSSSGVFGCFLGVQGFFGPTFEEDGFWVSHGFAFKFVSDFESFKKYNHNKLIA